MPADPGVVVEAAPARATDDATPPAAEHQASERETMRGRSARHPWSHRLSATEEGPGADRPRTPR
jgi:hypothetical protein